MPVFQAPASIFGKITVDCLIEAPTNFAYASSYQIDTSLKNDYAASGTLNGNITFTFTNVAANHQGMWAVRQDATGNRTVTITPPGGWSLYRDASVVSLAASAAANSVTIYTYAFVAVGGLNIMYVGKLTPVAGA